MKLRTAIIGLGNIAAFIDTPQSPTIASHTKAILTCEKTKLIAAYEPLVKNQEAFLQRWNIEIEFCESIEALLALEPDCVIVASPTRFHAKQLQRLLSSNVRYILCEKPLTHSSQALESLKRPLLKSDKKILVNLMRRYNPVIERLARDIASRRFGSFITLAGVCTKGILHNGIHLLALIEQLVGTIDAIKAQNTACNNKHDRTGTFFLRIGGRDASINVLPQEAAYSEFALTLWFSDAKIELKNGADTITIYEKRPSSLYNGYETLMQTSSQEGVLRDYALDSLRFLLTKEERELHAILQHHVELHEKVFDLITKGAYATSH